MKDKSILQSLRFLTLLGLMVLGIGNAWGGTDVTFEPTSDTSFPKDGITLSVSSGTLTNGTDYRVYKSATMTISSTVGNITNVALTYSNSYDGGGWASSYQPNATSWTSPIANGKQARITKIVVTVASLDKLNTPTGLTVGTPSATGTTLSWNTVENAGSYKVEYKISTELQWTTVSPNPTTTSCNLTGLMPETTYAWQVTAIPTNTSQYSNSEAASGADFTTAALQSYTVTWYVNGQKYTEGGPTTSVKEGSKVTTLPTTPTSPDATSTTFMGWTTSEITTKQASAPSVLFKTPSEAPAVTGETKYYAVFAKGEPGGNGSYNIKTTLTVGKTYVFGAVKAAASSTLANNTTFGAIAFTNDYNASSPTWGAKVDLTPDANGVLATTNVTDACKWVLESITDGNYAFKKGDKYLYIHSTKGSSSAANVGLNTSANVYLDNQNTNCKDAFILHSTSETTSTKLLYNTSNGYRSYDNSQNNSATMSPYVRFYEYTPGTTYSDYATQFATPLAAPMLSDVTDITSTSATITWSAVDNADSYQYKLGEGGWQTAGDCNQELTGLTAGTEYIVYVRANGSGDYCDGPASSKTFTTLFTVTAASNNGEWGTAKVSLNNTDWSNVVECTAGTTVYLQGTPVSADYTLSGWTTTSGSIVDNQLTGWTTNTTVTATFGHAEKTQLATPTGMSATEGVISTTLSWTAVEHASSYTVVFNSTTYTGITGTSKEITGLTAGVSYNWTVQAIGDGVTYSNSDVCATQTFTATALAVTSLAITTAPTTTNYLVGDAFDKTGMVVTASYNDGSSQPVSEYTVSPATFTEAGEQNVTISYTLVSTETATQLVNVKEKYVVSFNAGNGTCDTKTLSEISYNSGIDLPTATSGVDGWTFAGWAENTVTTTTEQPTLIAAGAHVDVTAAKTYYAVYSETAGSNTDFRKATSNDDIKDGINVVISSQGYNKYTLSNNNGTITGIPNFTETNNKISCDNSSAIWTLNGNSSNGFTIKNNDKYLYRSSTAVSASDNTSYWNINESSIDTRFYIKGKDTNYYLEYSGGWKGYSISGTPSETSITNYVGLTIYVPASITTYSSNPAAIVTPAVSFEDPDAHTIYLDGTTTYQNEASVTGIERTPVYSSSDESVATVAQDGTVTALSIGTTTIKALVAAEPGVCREAYATYDVTVKSAQTIASIKALTDNSSAVEFTADLTNAVVTYVSGDYAYIQDASAAIVVNYSDHGLTAGKKINGAVSGTVKAAYKIDALTALDINAATVTEDGEIPSASVVTIATIAAAPADYDGKLVTINQATVKNSLTAQETSGASISDDNLVFSCNLYAANKGISVNDTEIGNFTGFISNYNGSALRLNVYAQSQITITQLAALDQPLTFVAEAQAVDEETEEATSYTGQTVSGNKGAVTYSISGDEIATINSETGVVTLNGARGTATITATAAATSEVISGQTQPYNETSKTYTITVRPRYTVTFYANGSKVGEVLREATFGAGVTVPTAPEQTGYTLAGWTASEQDESTTQPTMVTITEGNYKPEDDITLNAVYTRTVSGGSAEKTYTITKDVTGFPTSYDDAGDLVVNEFTFYLSDVANFSGNMQFKKNTGTIINENALPAKITSVVVTYNSKTSCKNLGLYLGDEALPAGNEVTPTSVDDVYTFDCSGTNYKFFTLSVNTNNACNVDKIEITCGTPSTTYYTTNIPEYDEANLTFVAQNGQGYWATFSSENVTFIPNTVVTQTVVVKDTKMTMHKDVDGIFGEANTINIGGKDVTGYFIPANTGVLIKNETTSLIYYNVSNKSVAPVDEELNMLYPGQGVEITSPADCLYYKLAYYSSNRDKLGFYYGKEDGAAFTSRKGAAYLAIPKTSTQEVKGWSFDDIETAILYMDAESNTNEAIYNIGGQKLNKLQKGINIVNGKKILF